jgi:hypothetical protein
LNILDSHAGRDIKGLMAVPSGMNLFLLPENVRGKLSSKLKFEPYGVSRQFLLLAGESGPVMPDR